MHGKVALAKPFSEERLHLSLQAEGIAGVDRWNVAACGAASGGRLWERPVGAGLPAKPTPW
ncbi:hypothetical protein METHP14_690022 [Pseudomonas sp. P14-2025]